MSITTTGLPSVAAAVEVSREAILHDTLLRTTDRRVRVPWALLSMDLLAATGVAGASTMLVEAPAPVAAGTVVGAWLVAVAATGGYARTTGVRHPVRVRSLAAAGALLALAAWIGVAVGPMPADAAPADLARVVLLVAVLLPVLSALLRLVAGRLAAPARTPVVLAGPASRVRALLEESRRPVGRGRPSFVPVGVCLHGDPTTDELELPADVAIRSGTQHLMDLVRTQGAEAVVVAPGEGLDHAEVRRWAAWLQDERVDLLVSPGLRDVSTARLDLSSIGGARLLHVRPAPLSGATRVLKGVVDATLAVVLLVLFAPLLALLALLIRRDSPGPALFRQVRVGRDGQPFTVYKFRTMCQDADRIVDELADDNESDREGVLFKMKRDPRITRLGCVLRKYSLDELPQLINVVRGEMSLIGPRPALPSEVLGYSLDLRRRLVVKPGLTGLWQVSGRSDLSWEETVRLDLQYVDNWSWSLDLAIAVRTVGAVLGHKGAY
jgi:exopolysaccharide biosynthesis polyprenyl glycosylphosphotransferase